jgi:hypothetical protein
MGCDPDAAERKVTTAMRAKILICGDSAELGLGLARFY